MAQPDRAPSTVQNGGPPQQLHSTSQTKPKPGQQICQNYIRGLACHRSNNCRYFHDEQARINWANFKQEKKAAVEARKASTMSDAAKPKSSSLTIPSEARIDPPKQLITKPTASQTAYTSDTSPSMASTATTPLTDYVLPHLRNKSNGSSNASQPSSIDSAAGKLSFNEWNQQRAEIASSLTPRIADSTMVGQDHFDGVLKYKADMLTSNSGVLPLYQHHVKLLAAAKETAPTFTSKLPVDMPKNVNYVANGIEATAGFLHLEAGAGENLQAITDKMWAFVREGNIKNMSISTISSKSSRASRKSLNITAKVMGFIHRRVNTADAPAPLGVGHPAYDGGSEKPRVCLPNFGTRQPGPKKSRSPLGQAQSAVGLGVIHEAPLSSIPNAPSNDPVVLRHQNPLTVAIRDNSANINAWLDAAKFIAADDKAIEEAYITRAKEASSRTRIEIVSKFMPRPATAMNSFYGEALSEGKLLSRPAFPDASSAVAVSKPSNELIADAHTMTVAKTSINPEPSSSGVLHGKPGVVKINLRHQVPKESPDNRLTVTAKTGSMKAELCINYTRGFPCYYGDECDRYHDEELRNNTMMHPCTEYNSGQLCHNRKYCTLYHDMAIHNKNRKEMGAQKVVPVISGSSMAPINAPRCLEFALGHECRKPNCTLYHDTVFRNATRFASDVCFNFLLDLPCHVEMCRYRHDIDLRDTLNGVRSHRSMPFMDGACSNKNEVSGGGNRKHPQERPSVLAPIVATAHVGTSTIVPLCCNYILGMRCSGGSNGCRFLHDEGLRAQVAKNTCRNFALGFRCVADGGCRFYHDVKLRETLRDSKFRQASERDVSKVDSNHLSQGTLEGIQETTKSTILVENKAGVQNASIKPPSPAKSEGAAAWGDFAAHIAAEDAAVVTRALTNSSGRSQTSLVTVFRDRSDEAVDATAPKTKNTTNTSVGPGKKSGSTSRVVSITSREASNTKPIAANAVIESGNSEIPPPAVNDTRCNTKLTRFCPRFHGGRYHCENGDKCDFVHDPKLQTIYKSKDPRFQNLMPPRNGAKTSQWAKNSYDCGAW